MGDLFLGLTSSSNLDEFKNQELIGKSDAWIIKLDAARQVMWQTAFGGLETESLVKVLPLKTGDYILLINSNSTQSQSKNVPYYGGEDIWIICLDDQGEMKWQNSFGGQYDDVATDVIATSDDGLLIGGFSNSTNDGNKTTTNYGANDYWVIKLDSKGQEVWQNSYGGDQNDELKQVQETSKDNYKLFGISNSNHGNTNPTASNVNYWTLDIDKYGQVQQQWNYQYGDRNFLSNGFVSSDGLTLVGGTTVYQSGSETKVSYLGTLFASDGSVVWEKTISGEGENILSEFIQTRDGAFVFVGTSDSSPDSNKSSQRGMNDFWLVKVKASLSALPTSTDAQEQQADDQELEIPKIEAIPNPVDVYTNVIIPVEYTYGRLQVYDMGSRILLQKSIQYQTEPVNMSLYPPGTYVIVVKTDQIQGSVTIVKR